MFNALVYPITVAEMPSCARDLDRLMGESDRNQLIDYLAFNPQAGDVIPDTGGIRKVRWGLGNRGKRTGARVIYYFRDLNMPLYLLAAYAKNEKITLSAIDRKEMRSLVTKLVDCHSSRLEVNGTVIRLW
jgi:mRNA-degrading endonuclease RelE of RelBE toxin-antitoxin system